MAAIMIKPEYLVDPSKSTTSTSSSSHIIDDDDLEALVIEVTHRIMIASCLASTRHISRKLSFLDICYRMVRSKDKESKPVIERLENASPEENEILDKIIRKVTETIGLPDADDTSVCLFGIKPLQELTHSSKSKSEVEKRKKMQEELEKLISHKNKYSAPPSYPNRREEILLERINARMERIHSLLEKPSSSIAIAAPATPPTTPPVTPSATPITPPITPPALSTVGEIAVSGVPRLKLN